MYTVIFNFWRKASFLFLILLLLFCYVQFPDSIAVKHNQIGRPIGFMDKQYFFYLSSALIVGVNLILSLFKTQLLKIDFKKLKPLSVWAQHPENLSELISGWFYGLLALINTYLVFVLVGLQSINMNVSKNMDRDYDWFLFLGAALFLITLLILPAKLYFDKPTQN